MQSSKTEQALSADIQKQQRKGGSYSKAARWGGGVWRQTVGRLSGKTLDDRRGGGWLAARNSSVIAVAVVL